MKRKSTILYNIYENKALMFNTMSSLARYLGKTNCGNISYIAKGESNYLIIDKCYTIVYPEDYTINKLQKRLKAIRNNKGHRRGIIATDVLMNKKYKFKSTREAERSLGLSHGRVASVLNGEQETSQGYKFEYEGDINIPKELPEVTIYDSTTN